MNRITAVVDESLEQNMLLCFQSSTVLFIVEKIKYVDIILLMLLGDTSVRQQMNRLTAFIDLGTIYGNDQYYLKSVLDPNSSKYGILAAQFLLCG